MVKDRLSELKANATENLIENNLTRDDFMKDFFEHISKVKTNIEICQKKISEIEIIIDQISKCAIIDLQLTARLDELIEKVKVSIKIIKREIKKINDEQDKQQKISIKSIEYRIIKAQSEFLSHSLFLVVSNLNKIQLEYPEMKKKRIVRQLEIKGKNPNEDELEYLIDRGKDNVFSYELISETQRAKQVFQDIIERHDEFLNIEKKINEIHQMFLDLEFLVQSQGDIINRIEQNTEKSTFNTEKTNYYIEETIKNRKRRKKCVRITFFLLICFVAIIILFFLIYIFSYMFFFNISKKLIPF